jgi:hypothetical protein
MGERMRYRWPDELIVLAGRAGGGRGGGVRGNRGYGEGRLGQGRQGRHKRRALAEEMKTERVAREGGEGVLVCLRGGSA